MLQGLKKFLPAPLKKVLRPPFLLAHRITGAARPSLAERDWDMDVLVPREQREQFSSSCLEGTVGFNPEGRHQNVLLCAQPKSASLFITQVLSLALGYRNFHVGFNHKGGSVYYPRLLAAKFTGTGTVSHCHNPPDPTTLSLIRALNLKVVVLTRNLLDTIASRRDMLLADKWVVSMLSPLAVERFLTGSREYQIDVIIDLFAPSYINFFSGWMLQRGAEAVRPIYITFEEIHADTVALVGRVAEQLGETVRHERTRSIVDRIGSQGGINLNKGVCGRGREMINSRQTERLKRLALSLGCEDEIFLGFRME
jgi:hypothetical protein